MAHSSEWSRETDISLQNIVHAEEHATSINDRYPPPSAPSAPGTPQSSQIEVTQNHPTPASCQHLRARTGDVDLISEVSSIQRSYNRGRPRSSHSQSIKSIPYESTTTDSQRDGWDASGTHRAAHGGHDPEPVRPRARVQPSGVNFGTYYDLRPLLVRRHILMISISGTIGVGILISSGQIIRLAGSGGALLCYVLTGIIVYCVMSSLGEMVSLIPEAGALMEYPTRFVDCSLGWTIATAYWFCYAMGVCTLTTSTAILAKGWGADVGVGWIITAILMVVIVINVFGIRVFGEIEYVCGFLKVILAVGLVILMLAINRGAGPSGKVHGLKYWTEEYRFPPNFGGTVNSTVLGSKTTPHLTKEIGGALGEFLCVWKGMTLVAFSYIGVEIVAVTASEAKYPRDDLPRATRRIFWLTFCIYVAAVFSVSLNVPYTDPSLKNLFDTRPTTGQLSPFVIAIKNAGFDFLPGFVSAAILFASWSTTNTELFVASRTIYGMATKLDPIDYPYLSILGRTTKNGVPMTAIFVSCIFAPLAYLQCGGRDPQELLSVFSQVETVASLIVWMCQCLSFIRFYNGLQTGTAPHDRLSDDYPYCGKFQPWSAYLGFIGCALLILFNGIDVFIFKPFLQHKFLAAYLAAIVFPSVYIVAKVWTGTPIVAKSNMSYSVNRENFDRRRVMNDRGKLRGFLSWVFG